MSSISRLTAPVLAATFWALPALADLTAEEVWADWQSLAAEAGQTLTAGTQEQDGDVLRLGEVSVVAGFDEVTLTGTIPEVTLTERGDGSVDIAIAPEFPMQIEADLPDQSDFSADVRVGQTGFVTTAAGSPGNIDYTYSAEQMTLAMAQDIEGPDPVRIDLAVALQAMAGTTSETGAGPRSLDSTFSAGALIGTIAIRPEGDTGEVVDMTFTLESLVSESSGTLALMAPMANVGELIAEGHTTSGFFSHGQATYAVSVLGDDGSMQMNGGVTSGRFDMAMGPEGLDYGGGSTGITLSFAGSMVPVPLVNVAIDETFGRFVIPLIVTEDPQRYGMVLKILGLTIDDMIWSMFDPTTILPRDPLNLVFDVDGNVVITRQTDGMDSDATFSAGYDFFGEGSGVAGDVQNMSLNELDLSIAGARLSGNGGFTFDNTDLETFDGMPRPEGRVDITIEGVNTLLDNLIALGFLPEDQAMGARMMLGMFARPGAGEDTLTSSIEVTPDGQVLANGQRIR
jgi:hypothetical protein